MLESHECGAYLINSKKEMFGVKHAGKRTIDISVLSNLVVQASHSAFGGVLPSGAFIGQQLQVEVAKKNFRSAVKHLERILMLSSPKKSANTSNFKRRMHCAPL